MLLLDSNLLRGEDKLHHQNRQEKERNVKWRDQNPTQISPCKIAARPTTATPTIYKFGNRLFIKIVKTVQTLSTPKVIVTVTALNEGQGGGSQSPLLVREGGFLTV